MQRVLEPARGLCPCHRCAGPAWQNRAPFLLQPACPRALLIRPQFHLNRAAIWGIMLLRVLSCREWATAAAIVLVLLLPACTHSLPLPQYTR